MMQLLSWAHLANIIGHIIVDKKLHPEFTKYLRLSSFNRSTGCFIFFASFGEFTLTIHIGVPNGFTIQESTSSNNRNRDRQKALPGFQVANGLSVLFHSSGLVRCNS